MGKGKYYCAHLHMHSCQEKAASMKGHMHEAKRLGVDVIWFTDHDTLMGQLGSRLDGFDFENDDLIVRGRDIEPKDVFSKRIENIKSISKPLSREKLEQTNQPLEGDIESFYGWKPKKLSDNVSTKLKLVKENPYKGTQCLNMKVNTKGNEKKWESGGIDFVVKGRTHQTTLLTQITLKIACLIKTPIDQDARLIFEVTLSQQPPHHKSSRILYVIGETEGLENEYTAVVKIDTKIGVWNQLTLNITEDAKRHSALGGQIMPLPHSP